MSGYRRQSPLRFAAQPRETEVREGWEIVLEYENEGTGPFLIDLSHVPKWDVQGSNLEAVKPWTLTLPERPGNCRVEEGTLLSRTHPGQAVIWDLLMKQPEIPNDDHFTDVTDAFALLALLGDDLLPIVEKATPLDLFSPTSKIPRFVQGPVLRIPCQIALLGVRDRVSAVLIGCARGYGQSVVEALIDLGSPWPIRPAGEMKFRQWLGVAAVQ